MVRVSFDSTSSDVRVDPTNSDDRHTRDKAAADGRIRIPKGFTDPTRQRIGVPPPRRRVIENAPVSDAFLPPAAFLSQVAAARHGTDMGDEAPDLALGWVCWVCWVSWCVWEVPESVSRRVWESEVSFE